MRLYRAPKVIRLKLAQNPPKPINDSQREEELLQNILGINRELENKILDETMVKSFFVAQMEAGKMLQLELSLTENQKELEKVPMKGYSSLNDVRVEINILDENILKELANILTNKNINTKNECLKNKKEIIKIDWLRSFNELEKGYSVNVELARMKALIACFDKLCDLFN
uniref:Chorismate mutase domain-containing protein n=1 Tax=Meloidogyne hapla TaxID=6305 RepID=A0A1I8BP33_MELHA